MDTPRNDDVSFYSKKLANYFERLGYQLFREETFQDCSVGNLWVVDFLADHEDRELFQRDVETEFFISRATASKMLTLMEEKKLIRRTPAAGDGRLKRIELLPRGRELRALSLSIRAETERRATANLSGEEVAVFKRLCRKILAGLE